MTDVIYFDNAATTPVRAEVRDAMLPWLGGGTFGNPSSSHRFGRVAAAAVTGARRQIADALGVAPADVIFTSGGTEADNLAVIGTATAARRAGKPFRLAVSAIEHAAVRAAAELLMGMGAEVETIPMDTNGEIDVAALDEALGRGLALASVMWVNNEVGVVQDIAGLAARAAEQGVPFHTDAVQAVGKIPVSLDGVPCPLLTLSGHKLGGPQGVGALIVRNRKLVDPLFHGGAQQFALRPGTENVAGIVGLGRAVELAVAEVDEVGPRLGRLRDRFEQGLRAAVPDATVTAGGAPRAPHISHVTVPGIDSQAAQMHLDLAGIACSGGSACHTGESAPSAAVVGLGIPPERAARALRFSFYKQNTEDEVDRALSVIPQVVATVRGLATSLGRSERNPSVSGAG